MLSMLRPEGPFDHSRNDNSMSRRTLDNDDFNPGNHDNMITADLIGQSLPVHAPQARS